MEDAKPVPVKSEASSAGVAQGSLGKLLASYGSSSSDEEEEQEEMEVKLDVDTTTSVPVKVDTTPAPELLPNPFSIDKNEQEAKTSSNVFVEWTPLLPSLKTSPVTDFGAIKENKSMEQVPKFESDVELNVEDFLCPGNTSDAYKEVRPIKADVESSSSGTSDSEPDSEETSEDEDEYEERVAGGQSSKKKPQGPKAKGEFLLGDLPPIEDLHISVPHEKCKPIGVIQSVVEPLVIVEALAGTPVLDLDSVLFLEEGDRALGHIFDVIGPVKQPLYCVRFNSKEHIEKNQVKVGMNVYCAPKTPYTSYVFLAQLKRLRGSDASWCNDVEPPQEEVEFSDDEQERIARKKKKNRKRQSKLQATEADATEGELEQNDSETQPRGQKRHYNQGRPQQQPHLEGPPPFIPPMIPGFLPYGGNHPNNPWPQCYPRHPRGPKPPRFRGHYHRGGFPRFGPPQPQNVEPNYWLPPPPRQWQTPYHSEPRLNFTHPTYQNPFRQPYANGNRFPPPPGEGSSN